jgi:hypothetical protein
MKIILPVVYLSVHFPFILVITFLSQFVKIFIVWIWFKFNSITNDSLVSIQFKSCKYLFSLSIFIVISSGPYLGTFFLHLLFIFEFSFFSLHIPLKLTSIPPQSHRITGLYSHYRIYLLNLPHSGCEKKKKNSPDPVARSKNPPPKPQERKNNIHTHISIPNLN